MMNHQYAFAIAFEPQNADHDDLSDNSRSEWQQLIHELEKSLKLENFPEFQNSRWEEFGDGHIFWGTKSECDSLKAVLSRFPVSLYEERNLEPGYYANGESTYYVGDNGDIFGIDHQASSEGHLDTLEPLWFIPLDAYKTQTIAPELALAFQQTAASIETAPFINSTYKPVDILEQQFDTQTNAMDDLELQLGSELEDDLLGDLASNSDEVLTDLTSELDGLLEEPNLDSQPDALDLFDTASSPELGDEFLGAIGGSNSDSTLLELASDINSLEQFQTEEEFELPEELGADVSAAGELDDLEMSIAAETASPLEADPENPVMEGLFNPFVGESEPEALDAAPSIESGDDADMEAIASDDAIFDVAADQSLEPQRVDDDFDPLEALDADVNLTHDLANGIEDLEAIAPMSEEPSGALEPDFDNMPDSFMGEAVESFEGELPSLGDVDDFDSALGLFDAEDPEAIAAPEADISSDDAFLEPTSEVESLEVLTDEAPEAIAAPEADISSDDAFLELNSEVESLEALTDEAPETDISSDDAFLELNSEVESLEVLTDAAPEADINSDDAFLEPTSEVESLEALTDAAPEADINSDDEMEDLAAIAPILEDTSSELESELDSFLETSEEESVAQFEAEVTPLEDLNPELSSESMAEEPDAIAFMAADMALDPTPDLSPVEEASLDTQSLDMAAEDSDGEFKALSAEQQQIIETLEQENQQLRAEIEAAQRSANAKVDPQEYEAVKAELSGLTHEIQTLEQTNQQLTAEVEKWTQVANSKIDLETYDKLSQTNQEQALQLTAFQQEIDDLKQEVSKWQEISSEKVSRAEYEEVLSQIQQMRAKLSRSWLTRLKDWFLNR